MKLRKKWRVLFFSLKCSILSIGRNLYGSYLRCLVNARPNFVTFHSFHCKVKGYQVVMETNLVLGLFWNCFHAADYFRNGVFTLKKDLVSICTIDLDLKVTLLLGQGYMIIGCYIKQYEEKYKNTIIMLSTYMYHVMYLLMWFCRCVYNVNHVLIEQRTENMVLREMIPPHVYVHRKKQSTSFQFQSFKYLRTFTVLVLAREVSSDLLNIVTYYGKLVLLAWTQTILHSHLHSLIRVYTFHKHSLGI